ncbi:ADP,ATP carrier protein [Scenedesmus sp. PABB004]|nr:ADP,ATP carrier protein [Scenedesmus sp. PABB004]
MAPGGPPTAGAAGEQPPRGRRRPPETRAQLARDLATGMVTSGVYTTATYPIHRVKILLQTQDANPRIISGKVPRYSFVHSFGRLAREQGVLGLWRGNTPYLLRHVPSISMSFAFKDAFREALPRVDAAARPAAALAVNAAAGAAAGALSLALVYPFEFATVRLAADLGAGAADRQFGNGMLSAWLTAMRSGGAGVYQGFGVAVASMAAYKALYFGLHDSAKAALWGEQAAGRVELAPRELAARTLLAAATTVTAATLTYPLDIIRKRLIVELGAPPAAAAAAQQLGPGGGGAVPAAGTAPRRGGFAACARRIYAREGLRGFFRFWGFDMVFRAGGGLLLVGYDVLRSPRDGGG